MFNQHGGDIYSYNEKLLDFSVNINPLGISGRVKEAVYKSIDKLENYPDVMCRRLREKIALNENVCIDNVICANGAAEIIYNIVYALNPKKVLITSPVFSEYEKACFFSEKIYYDTKEENNFEIRDDIKDCIDDSIDIVFLCNPNNPTGKIIEKNLLNEIIRKSRFTVVDESFVDFTEERDKNSLCVSDYNNVIIIKSLTKIYAIPGLRLGYGLCGSKKIIDMMYKVRQPWCVSIPAQEAGLQALKEKEYIKKTNEYVKKEKKYLYENLKKLGIIFFESSANYILFKEEKDFDLQMLKYNILIRNCENFRGLNGNYFRIAVKSHADNETLINAFEKVRENGKSNYGAGNNV